LRQSHSEEDRRKSSSIQFVTKRPVGGRVARKQEAHSPKRSTSRRQKEKKKQNKKEKRKERGEWVRIGRIQWDSVGQLVGWVVRCVVVWLMRDFFSFSFFFFVKPAKKFCLVEVVGPSSVSNCLVENNSSLLIDR
jgi:hypothetical protein